MRNEMRFFFELFGCEKEETEASSFPLFSISALAYFTTNLMVLLKPLALMVQK